MEDTSVFRSQKGDKVIVIGMPLMVILSEAIVHLRQDQWLGHVYVGIHRVASCPRCRALASSGQHAGDCTLMRTIRDLRTRMLLEVQAFLADKGTVRTNDPSHPSCDCEPGGERFIIDWPEGVPTCHNVGEVLKRCAKAPPK